MRCASGDIIMIRTKKTAADGDLTEGVIWKKLLGFFFPILFGMLFQQLYNTADAIIVGQFVGTEALAAVGGSASVIINLVIGFFTGLASGASVIISQCFGARDDKRLSRTAHTIVCFCLVAGALVSAAACLLTPWALRLVRNPAETMADSILYLRIYFVGTIPLMLFNVGSGILRAVGDSRRPLRFLIVCCLSNIALDVVFVVVLRMGVAGVAWATVLAQLLSAVLVMRCLMRAEGPVRISVRELRLDWPALRSTLGIGVSAGVQSAMYSISNIIIQAAVNDLGTTLVAAWTATSKIDGVFWVTSNAFGIAICAFVGQCYGAGKIERMRKSVRVCFLMALGTAAVMSMGLIGFARPLLRLVTADGQVITLAAQIMRFFVPYYAVWIVIEIVSNTLRGVGDAVRPMLIVTVGVCLIRILWIAFVVPLYPGIRTISYSYPVSWSITALALTVYYFRSGRKWRSEA